MQQNLGLGLYVLGVDELGDTGALGDRGGFGAAGGPASPLASAVERACDRIRALGRHLTHPAHDGNERQQPDTDLSDTDPSDTDPSDTDTDLSHSDSDSDFRDGDSDFRDGEQGAVEAVEHLVDQLVVWFSWETLHADSCRPAFHRHNDLISQWGGPNADNVYRHARIDPSRRYVVRGRMHSCDEFLLAIRAGFMHRPVWGTLGQVTASELGIAPGDDFELHFGGDHPKAIDLPDSAIMLSVREYYFDWRAEEPATFTIECLDPEPPMVLTADVLAHRIDESMNEIEESIAYWNTYLADNRAERTDNSFAANTLTVGKGLSIARYEFCFWDLGADQALVIECDEPDARYWAVQLYTMQNFELVDPFGSVTSRNHTQTTRSPDGRVRFVLAASDPGHANWLDTTNRRQGLCTLRWFWPHSDQRPTVSTSVMNVDDVARFLAENEPQATPKERADELATRQNHLRWRFRT